MKRLIFRLIVGIFFISYLFIACSKDDVNDNSTASSTTTVASATTQKVNNFIKTVMSDVYLWYNYLPTIDTKYETD